MTSAHDLQVCRLLVKCRQSRKEGDYKLKSSDWKSQREIGTWIQRLRWSRRMYMARPRRVGGKTPSKLGKLHCFVKNACQSFEYSIESSSISCSISSSRPTGIWKTSLQQQTNKSKETTFVRIFLLLPIWSAICNRSVIRSESNKHVKSEEKPGFIASIISLRNAMNKTAYPEFIAFPSFPRRDNSSWPRSPSQCFKRSVHKYI